MFSWHPGLREVKIVRREKAITAVASTCAKFCPMHVRGPATLRSSPSDQRFGHIDERLETTARAGKQHERQFGRQFGWKTFRSVTRLLKSLRAADFLSA